MLFAESLRPIAIVESQSGWMWNAIVQPIGFITFLVSAKAETKKAAPKAAAKKTKAPQEASRSANCSR